MKRQDVRHPVSCFRRGLESTQPDIRSSPSGQIPVAHRSHWSQDIALHKVQDPRFSSEIPLGHHYPLKHLEAEQPKSAS